MRITWSLRGRVAALLSAATLLTGGTHAVASPPPSATGGPTGAFTATVFASGRTLSHVTPKGREVITQPDDITSLGKHVFVGFQNGVGPQGQASPSGNLASTIVEFNLRGRAVEQWDVVGKCDGLTADPLNGRLIATVNEDANSSLYVINPIAASKPDHYRYDVALPSKGGTDAISVYRGMMLISASAPGTTGASAPQPSYPAVYRVALDTRRDVADVYPLFYDEASAKVANTNGPATGTRVRLALTDPDSNEIVPSFAKRFAGDFMLTSQGDKKQIFLRGTAGLHPGLSVLRLSDSVDDTAWASDRAGAIFTTDNSGDTIDRITGPFGRGAAFVADTPCDANDAPPVCPAPGFPPNYLGQLNPDTGAIARVPVNGAAIAPQGMLFLP